MQLVAVKIAGAVDHEHFYDSSARGICNSEIVVHCSQTMHEMVLLNIHRPGH